MIIIINDSNDDTNDIDNNAVSKYDKNMIKFKLIITPLAIIITMIIIIVIVIIILIIMIKNNTAN